METWHATARTMPVAMECETNTQNKPGMPWTKWVAIHNFVASAFLHYKISTQKCFRTLQLCQCPWNVKSTLKTNLDRLGEKLVAIHNFVASAFLHYKISTQKWFKFRRLCQWPWNVKSTLKTNPDRLGQNGLLSTTSSLQLFCTTKYLLRNASELYNYASVHGM